MVRGPIEADIEVETRWSRGGQVGAVVNTWEGCFATS